MKVAGIDTHATYLVVRIVSKPGERLAGPTRTRNEEARRLVELLDEHGPTHAVTGGTRSVSDGRWPGLSPAGKLARTRGRDLSP